MRKKTGSIFKIVLIFMCYVGFALGAAAYADGTRWNNEDSAEDIGSITDYIYSAVLAAGGAIYYTSGDIGTISGTYTGNYAQSTTSGNNALGGAVYSAGDITIYAGAGSTTTFSGNYTVSGSGSVAQNAIFMDTTNGAVTLTLNSYGTIIIDDTIDGGVITDSSTNTYDRTSTKYNLVLTGDTNGVIELNNTVYAANVTLDNVNLYIKSSTFSSTTTTFTANSGTVSMVDGSAATNTIRYLTSGSSVLYYLDVDGSNIDRISTDATSTGTVTIGGFNYVTELSDNLSQTYTNVLNSTTMTLAVAASAAVTNASTAGPNIKYSDEWTKSGAEAVQTSSGWDLIIYNNYVIDDNPLMTLNTTDYDGESRTYVFDASGQTYTAVSSLGTTDPNSTLTISGYSDGSSVINGGGKYQMFTLADSTTVLEISRVTLENAYSSTYGSVIYNTAGTLTLSSSVVASNSAVNAGAIYNAGTITVSSTTFSSNTATTYGGAIYNTGTATITDSTFTGNSAVTGGAIYNTGAMSIAGSTFATTTDSII